MAEVTSLGLGKTMEKKLHSIGIHSADIIELDKEISVCTGDKDGKMV